jgi:N-acetylgalactosamine-6-sulfatase
MLACLLVLLVHTAAVAAERPNIIFIFADDWGWGDLGCHGNNKVKTPNLDRLAEQGTDFAQFFVCNPVCSPSRTAVMTGQFPARHGVHQHFSHLGHQVRSGMPDWLDPTLVMLPRLFKEAGYKTGHFGKWHLSGARDAPIARAYGYDEVALWGGPGPRISPADSGVFDKTIAFIKKHKDASFFMNVWIHQTHTPHFVKERFLKDYKDQDERQQVYSAVVAEGDEGVGRIMQTLDDLKLTDNTLIVFSSDNGPEEPARSPRFKKMKNEKGLSLWYSVGSSGGLKGHKRSLYEGGVRVPFIVRWPGKTPAGKTNDTTVIAAVDLLPTFCRAAGIDLPDGYQSDGQDLLDAFLGKAQRRTKSIYWEWTGSAFQPWGMRPKARMNWPRLGVRDGEWKLLMTHDGKRKELYNITQDRAEQSNLADKHPDVVKRLAGMALEWKAALPKEPPKHCISKHRK